MPDSFENKMNEKMAELRLQPEDAVWQNIENDLLRKKQRRKIIFWWLMPLAGIGILSYLYFSSVSNAGRENNNDKKIVHSTIQIPGKAGYKTIQTPDPVNSVAVEKKYEAKKSSEKNKPLGDKTAEKKQKQFTAADLTDNNTSKPSIIKENSPNKTATEIENAKAIGTENNSKATHEPPVNTETTLRPVPQNINSDSQKVEVQIINGVNKSQSSVSTLQNTLDSAIALPVINTSKTKKLQLGAFIDVGTVFFQPPVFPVGIQNKSFSSSPVANVNASYSITTNTLSHTVNRQLGAGIVARYYTGKHFYFETGAELHYFKFESTNSIYKDSFVIGSSGAGALNPILVLRMITSQQQFVTHNYNVQLPLLAGWEFKGKKFSLGFTGGLQNIFQLGKVSITNSFSAVSQTLDQQFRLRKYIPALYLGFSAGTYLRNKKLFSLQPYLQLGGRSYLMNGSFKDAANFYGLRLQYFFK